MAWPMMSRQRTYVHHGATSYCRSSFKLVPSSTGGSCSRMLLHVLVILSLLASRTFAASCAQASGAATSLEFCNPGSSELQTLSSASFSASSTIKDGDRYCFSTLGKETCAMAGVGEFDVASVARASGRWQSAVLQMTNTEVTVTLHLPTNLIIYSLQAVIMGNVPARFELQTSRDGGRTWQTRYTFASSSVCDELDSGKAFCFPYELSRTVTPIYTEADLQAMLGNTQTVNSFLNGTTSPLANAVRVMFRQAKMSPPEQQYYRLDQLIVNGTCWCNGHARNCLPSGQCDCTDQTTTARCEACLSGFYPNRFTGGFSCNPCGCNTSAGALQPNCSPLGMCQCRVGYTGQHCETCSAGYFRQQGRCVRCNCSVGALNQLCDAETGQCMCRPAVEGRQCNQCRGMYYGLDETGCRACDCVGDGAVTATQCNVTTGQCQCHINVEGRQCDRCQPGFTGLSTVGCTSPMPSLGGAVASSSAARATSPTTASSSVRHTPSEGGTDRAASGSSNSTSLVLIYAFIPAGIALITLAAVIIFVYRRKHRKETRYETDDLSRKDSSSSRARLHHHYASNGPRSSPDESIAHRKMSRASLYDTADVVAPHLRNSGDFSRATSASLPNSQRHSLINEERFAVMPSTTPVQEQLISHLGSAPIHLTAYDISKITHPPPEPYARSNFKINPVGPQPMHTGTTNGHRPVPMVGDPYITMTATESCDPIAMTATESCNPIAMPGQYTVDHSGMGVSATSGPQSMAVAAPEPSAENQPAANTCQYTLPDLDIKHQRRELKRQKSLPSCKGDSLDSPSQINAAPIRPTSEVIQPHHSFPTKSTAESANVSRYSLASDV